MYKSIVNPIYNNFSDHRRSEYSFRNLLTCIVMWIQNGLRIFELYSDFNLGSNPTRVILNEILEDMCFWFGLIQYLIHYIKVKSFSNHIQNILDIKIDEITYIGSCLGYMCDWKWIIWCLYMIQEKLLNHVIPHLILQCMN